MYQVQQSSKVNYVSEKNKNINPNGARKKRKAFDSDSKKKHVTYYHCGKKVCQEYCRFKKKLKKEGMTNVQVAETNVEKIIAIVLNLHIGMNRFKYYKDAAEGQQVLMENANTTTVLGKENVEVQFTYGKKLLTNILHDPEFCKNLVSAAILSKKGLKTVIETDKLIVTKNGEIVGKGYYCIGTSKLCTTMNVMKKLIILLMFSSVLYLLYGIED
ncbi:UNVERIFIED_CONTAM: hypothetical protein Slati_1332100 [Sesamum latifolium]|uniref:Retrovirus-related Pol polyprotein from transposon TNT 1-94-like beta-barrel domain-containing protein n=1 Tax=Sesamum latifolium TaxID=2727402 RepID=A0AAW2XNW0_9LAMI